MSKSKHDYITSRKSLKGFFFETALPNEYLVQIGARKLKPTLGGRRFRLFRKFLRVPASIQTLEFVTDNANMHFQGLGIEGFASWQINPEAPAKAIATLDLFDGDNPMARTNDELKLICIEAVRHVIANMSIEDAHRKKNDIAEALKVELRGIEEAWGILFHQVGIKKVTVMSSQLFNDMQASYRNQLRLQSETTRIDTDKKLSTEENHKFEQENKERLASEQRISEIEINNKTLKREQEIQQNQKLAQKEHEVELEKQSNRVKEKEHELAGEKAVSESEFDLAAEKKKLELELNQEHELAVLKVRQEVEGLNKSITEIQTDIQKMRRSGEQTFSEEYLQKYLLDRLPEVAGSLAIDNYTVFDSVGGGITPVAKLVQEVVGVLKSNNIFGGAKTEPNN